MTQRQVGASTKELSWLRPDMNFNPAFAPLAGSIAH